MDSQIPCVFVASKTDLPEASQQPGLSPAEFCYKHCLPPPFLFSCHSQGPPGTAVYTKLAAAATFPLVSVPPGQGAVGWEQSSGRRAAGSARQHLTFGAVSLWLSAMGASFPAPRGRRGLGCLLPWASLWQIY